MHIPEARGLQHKTLGEKELLYLLAQGRVDLQLGAADRIFFGGLFPSLLLNVPARARRVGCEGSLNHRYLSGLLDAVYGLHSS